MGFRKSCIIGPLGLHQRRKSPVLRTVRKKGKQSQPPVVVPGRPRISQGERSGVVRLRKTSGELGKAQQIKLLTGKTSLATCTNVLSQGHSNDQPVGSVVPYARLGTPAEAPNTVKVWKSVETAIAHLSPWNSCCAAENTQSHYSWERCYLLKFAMRCPTGWVSYFAPLGEEGELLTLYWNPVVLMQVSPIEMPSTRNGAHPAKRGECGGPGLVYSAPSPSAHA